MYRVVDGLERYALNVLQGQPIPPRRIDRRRVRRLCYGSSHSRILAGAGVLCLVLGLWTVLESQAGFSTGVNWPLPAVLLCLSVQMLAHSVHGAHAWSKALCNGLPTEARVVELETRPRDSQAGRVPAGRYVAEGVWIVRHPSGDFETSFTLDTSWAGDITLDSTVEVLVDPVRPRVLLGLAVQPQDQSVPSLPMPRLDPLPTQTSYGRREIPATR